MSPRSFALALALAAAPGLALAQPAPSDPGQSAMPPNFGDPDERAAPAGPDAGSEESPEGRGEPGQMHRGGMAHGGMMGQMMDHAEMMRRHHGGGQGDDGPGSASISIRSGDRALMIRCGDTPIPDCVSGAQPLIELMR